AQYHSPDEHEPAHPPRRRVLPSPTPGPLLHRQGIPNAHRLVARARHQPGTVRTPGQRVDIGRVAVQLRHFLERRQSTEANSGIGTAGRQARAVGAEGHAIDLAPVWENGQLLARLKVPDAGGAVIAARGEPAPVAAEADRVDLGGVAGENLDLTPRG